MTLQPMLRCTNCGTEWHLEDAPAEHGRALAVPTVCPVCRLPFSSDDAAPTPVGSIGELVTQLGALISSARDSGVDADAIVQALRDELEFAAEMREGGRHFSVQLIDLGPREGAILRRPVHDRRAILQNRSAH